MQRLTKILQTHQRNMKNIVSYALMAAFVNYACPAQAQLTGISTASVAQATQGINAAEDQLLVSESTIANSGKQTGGKQNGGNSQSAAPKKKASLLPKGGEVSQSKRGAYATPPRKGGQLGTSAFTPIDSLLADYPDAVSIEVRVNKAGDYKAAIIYYQNAFGSIKPDSNTYSCSWAYRLANTAIEILVINTSNVPGGKPAIKLKKGTVGYVNWPGITTKAAMITAYDCATQTGAFEAEERPGDGPVGARDAARILPARNPVRAVLKKRYSPRPYSVKFLQNRQYDGVIINPPVP